MNLYLTRQDFYKADQSLIAADDSKADVGQTLDGGRKGRCLLIW